MQFNDILRNYEEFELVTNKKIFNNTEDSFILNNGK